MKIQRRRILIYKELELDNLMEIDSVSSFISRIKELLDTKSKITEMMKLEDKNV